MASILDMSASSDSEDDDYVPPTNAASDSSCDEGLTDEEGPGDSHVKKNETKKADVKDAESAKVDEKKRAKDLWESFLNDVESITPKKPNIVCTTEITSGENETKTPKIDTKKSFSDVFEFAEEADAAVKDVNSRDSLSPAAVKDVNSCDSPATVKDVNSCDSPAAVKDVDSCDSPTAGKTPASQPVPAEKPPCMPQKRGIDSLLDKIMNKNKKMSVLEKSKLDWGAFKKDEGLDNELEKVNKGKQGYLERQRFLERSDLRSFEMEKSMRQTLRKK